ncbi:hypothetical protein OAE38_00715 [Akkermansiaceae bacterium]|nr:hypothetical protein [Akkermansiaceae bacterium]
MKKNNVYWIIVDSVRTYKTGKDDRDRIDIIDDFSRCGIEFQKAYTSAPSSVLSASSMFTGLPATYISRHFSDWEFNPQRVDTLQNSLVGNGYSIYSIYNSREERRMLRSLIHPIAASFYPKGVSHRNWWTNKECTEIFERSVKAHDSKEGGFFTIWYDCRRDPSINEEVERAFKIIKEANNFEDSIIILSSDHGYPDPESGLNEDSMRKFSHDMIITEDNVRVPLVIKLPKGPKGLKISSAVGLKDVFPTINEFLGLKAPNQEFKYMGASLLSLISRGKEIGRVARIDTRLNMAAERITALVSNNIKYVKYWDENIEEIYDLNTDPKELYNQLDGGNRSHPDLVKFRTILVEMEEELDSFLLDELKENFQSHLQKIKGLERAKKIRIISTTAPQKYINLLTNVLIKMTGGTIHIVDNVGALEKPEKAEYSFYVTENTKTGAFDRELFSTMKEKSEKVIMMDFNGRVFNRFLMKWIWPVVSYVRENSFFYRSEPTLLFYDLLFIAKSGFGKLFGNQRGLHIDGNKVKRMRDRELKASASSD